MAAATMAAATMAAATMAAGHAPDKPGHTCRRQRLNHRLCLSIH
jgi:hypothetical protein